MYQWLYDNGAHNTAHQDQSFGCTNPFLDGFLDWVDAKNNPDATETEETPVESTNDDVSVDLNDFLRPDSTFDYDGYYAAMGTSAEELDKSTQQAAEAAGGEYSTEEEGQKRLEEGREFGEGMAEKIEDGTVDKILQNVYDDLGR